MSKPSFHFVSKPTVALIFALALAIHTIPARAQNRPDAPSSGMRYQPPKPPPLDGPDFDDEEDGFDEDVFRPSSGGLPGAYPPGTPIPGNGSAPMGQGAYPPQGGGAPGMGGGLPPMGNDYRPMPSSQGAMAPGKFHFKIVEDEFWEPHKKRSRGKEIHVNGNASSPAG